MSVVSGPGSLAIPMSQSGIFRNPLNQKNMGAKLLAVIAFLGGLNR
jgi:hypothetical protein